MIINLGNFTGTITTNESTSLGVSNLAPETTSITIGSPANVIIQYDTTAGGGDGGNVIIGEGNGDIDGSLTPFRLDVRGSANVGALSATSLSGTLSTAAQGNITSLGTLTSLTVLDRFWECIFIVCFTDKSNQFHTKSIEQE